MYSYEILAANAIPKGFMDGKQACCLMVRYNFLSFPKIMSTKPTSQIPSHLGKHWFTIVALKAKRFPILYCITTQNEPFIISLPVFYNHFLFV